MARSRLNTAAHEIFVLITLFSNKGSDKPVQICICCLHTQSLDKDEDSDQSLDL